MDKFHCLMRSWAQPTMNFQKNKKLHLSCKWPNVAVSLQKWLWALILSGPFFHRASLHCSAEQEDTAQTRIAKYPNDSLQFYKSQISRNHSDCYMHLSAASWSLVRFLYETDSHSCQKVATAGIVNSMRMWCCFCNPCLCFVREWIMTSHSLTSLAWVCAYVCVCAYACA